MDGSRNDCGAPTGVGAPHRFQPATGSLSGRRRRVVGIRSRAGFGPSLLDAGRAIRLTAEDDGAAVLARRVAGLRSVRRTLRNREGLIVAVERGLATEAGVRVDRAAVVEAVDLPDAVADARVREARGVAIGEEGVETGVAAAVEAEAADAAVERQGRQLADQLEPLLAARADAHRLEDGVRAVDR